MQCELDHEDMPLGQSHDPKGHDTNLGHEQQLCEVLSITQILLNI